MQYLIFFLRLPGRLYWCAGLTDTTHTTDYFCRRTSLHNFCSTLRNRHGTGSSYCRPSQVLLPYSPVPETVRESGTVEFCIETGTDWDWSYYICSLPIKGEVRSKIKLSHFVEFGALIRMVLVRGASEQPFLRYSNFKDYQIWESLFMSRWWRHWDKVKEIKILTAFDIFYFLFQK